VLLGRTVEPVVLVAAAAGLVPTPELPLEALALVPLGRAEAADAPDPAELDWLGGGLPDGRLAGGEPARCWRRRLALLTWLPR
jgi:hypothetical protein